MASVADLFSLRESARKIAEKQRNRLAFARTLVAGIISCFRPEITPPIEPLKHPLAQQFAAAVQAVDLETALYAISTVYTVTVPVDYRARYGVFYTPPALANRLLDMAEEAGVEWTSAKVIDPACGGGAFLAPVAARMIKALSVMGPGQRIRHIETHLRGFEIDPFAAWMSQCFVEIILADDLRAIARPLAKLISVCDSLQTPQNEYNQFDLVIGNPPYGRIKLSDNERSKWQRSLYGHANLYGLFADLAVRLAKPHGVIAYITPSSFLGGQYFKNLRSLLATYAPLAAIDFIGSRTGVFTDVLQETVLAVYRTGVKPVPVSVSFLSVRENGVLSVEAGGRHHLSTAAGRPWLLPRSAAQTELIYQAALMPHRLADLGYEVSTGPLVWNRHKDRLYNRFFPGVVPVIWAESVDPSGSGRFSFKAEGRNHKLWYKPYGEDDPNLVRHPCVLLQRTTALEQSRRLVAAELSQTFIDRHGGQVAVENHLNMIRPIPGQTPAITPKALTYLLNSQVLDQLFRCINGSTAVSAYELESLPLPDPEELKLIDQLIARRSSHKVIEEAIREMYSHVCRRAFA